MGDDPMRGTNYIRNRIYQLERDRIAHGAGKRKGSKRGGSKMKPIRRVQGGRGPSKKSKASAQRNANKNPWLIFYAEYRRKHKNSDMPVTEMAKKASKEYNRLSEKEKDKLRSKKISICGTSNRFRKTCRTTSGSKTSRKKSKGKGGVRAGIMVGGCGPCNNCGYDPDME